MGHLGQWKGLGGQFRVRRKKTYLVENHWDNRDESAEQIFVLHPRPEPGALPVPLGLPRRSRIGVAERVGLAEMLLLPGSRFRYKNRYMATPTLEKPS